MIDIREGDAITSESGAKSVKVDEIACSQKGLYVFVNKRFRYDAGGFVYRVSA